MKVIQYKNLLIHMLAFGAGARTIKELDHIASRAATLGASGLELLFHPMPVLPPDRVAKVFKRHGLRKASLCLFFPQDLSCGDPTSVEEGSNAVKHVRRAVEYVCRLRDEGIKINVIDGPLNIVLGRGAQEYTSLAVINTAIFSRSLSVAVGEMLGITFCSEVLQRSEDGLIRTSARMGQLVTAVASSAFKMHLDTFHTVKNGERLGEVIKRFGPHIGHLHLNGIGKDRAREGRIPCGCRDFEIDGRRYTDTIDWKRVRHQLSAAQVDLNKVLVCLEPFHEKACQAIPPLREGVVPVTNDWQILESVDNLAAAGILQRSRT